MDTRKIPIQNFQHLRTPNTPSDGGPTLQLHVDPKAKLIAVHKFILVPLLWQQEVKASRTEFQTGGPGGCSSGRIGYLVLSNVLDTEENGESQRSVDMQVLNKHAVRFSRQRWCLLGPRRQSTILGMDIIVPIHLTTFITQWGARCKTCPQGYAASQNRYTKRFEEIVIDFPNKTKCIDNTCLRTDTLEESFQTSRNENR